MGAGRTSLLGGSGGGIFVEVVALMEARKFFSLDEAAGITGGTCRGNASRCFRGVCSPDRLREDFLVAVWDRRRLDSVPSSWGVMTSPSWVSEGRDVVEVANPRQALALLLQEVYEEPLRSGGIHPSAVVSPEAHVAPGAWVGPGCVVEAGAVLEEGAVLEGQDFVGYGVHIGPRVWIAPQVVLYPRTVVGARTRIHSGTVLGADGFGVLLEDEGAGEAIPHVGTVVIEEDVVLGAHVTVDRGTLDVTRVGAGTKVDDHVHVGHNADIGKRCVLVAYVGIAGSAVVEDGSILAARSGVASHVRIGRGARLAAMAGATRDIPPGAVVSGFPAWDHRKALRVESLVRRLPELAERLKRLEKGGSPETPPTTGETP